MTASDEFLTGDNVDAASHVPLVLTGTWFHTGDRVARYHTGDTYREPVPADAPPLDDTVLRAGLTAGEEREACRALKEGDAAAGGLYAQRHRQGFAPLHGDRAEPHRPPPATARRQPPRSVPRARPRVDLVPLKAADICALEPERAARLVLASGVAEHYHYALQTMQGVPYGRWREHDPEDTVRFYALRLHEAGMIQSTLQTIIESGTGWSFFSDLKKTLKDTGGC